jgi:hypothetical protein
MRRAVVTPDQCRAARALLQWKGATLAFEARVGMSTVTNFETRARRTRPAKVKAMRRALEIGGVRFIGLRGVEFK